MNLFVLSAYFKMTDINLFHREIGFGLYEHFCIVDKNLNTITQIDINTFIINRQKSVKVFFLCKKML